MSNQRLLLVLDDPFLAKFFGEKLTSAGFPVDIAHSVAHAIEVLEHRHPALIVLDSLLLGSDAADSAEALRKIEKASTLPLVILPTPHYTLSQRVEAIGGVSLLTSISNPLGELLKHVSEVLATGKQTEGSLMLATLPDEGWKHGAVDAAQVSVDEMRHCLHDLARAGADQARLLQSLLQQVHRLAGSVGLLSRSSLTTISAALEIMVYNLALFPERLDSLALRTLSQAADFLTVLLHDGTYARIPEIDSANIMIIEDEESARELIIAAMELVGLNARGLGTPQSGLTALGDNACDLIFLDINLPEMNGFDLCHKVRSLPLHERTPIVFLTGMTTFQNRAQSSLSGGNDFIGKPFNVAELGVKALMWVMKGRLGLN